MHATWQLAADYWNSQFREAELKEDIENAKRLAERHRTETHYRIAPNITPGLIDEYSRSSRNPSEMDWAEQRLADLGFQNICENNVKSHTKEYDNFVIYADPRENGKISFRVYKKPIPKKGHRLLFNMFYLFDNWKNDIRGKYESRLQKIVSNDKVSA